MAADDERDEEDAASPTYVLSAGGGKYWLSSGGATFDLTASGSAALGAVDKVQAKEIESLDPTFQAMSERDLFVILKDEQDIGPKIRVFGVPETTIRAVGAYEQQRRSHKRDDRKWLIKVVVAAVIGLALGRLSGFI